MGVTHLIVNESTNADQFLTMLKLGFVSFLFFSTQVGIQVDSKKKFYSMLFSILSADISACRFMVTCNEVSGVLIHKM